MFRNFFPSKILLLTNKTINSLVILLVIVVITGLTYSLLISPPDYIQGDSVRIMYVHVPSSFIALGCFGFIGIASICNVIFKIKLQIEDIPMNPKQPRAIKDDGTCTYIILTASPWI